MEMIAPVTHVLPLTTIRRERLLPISGKVFVRLGQKVKPSDVVAEANLAPEHVLLDVSRGLGVSGQQADALIQYSAGDSVMEDDIIASRSGLARRVVRSPVAGRVVMVGDGQVLIEAKGQPAQVLAGIPGTVVEQVDQRGAVIETTGALIQGVWGNGGLDFGLMRVLSETPGELLIPDHLDVRMRGSVVLAGYCDREETLVAAADLVLRGLILGSMEAHLIPRANRIRFPIIVMEGFGARPMNAATFKLLSTNDNREVVVIGERYDRYAGTRPEVIIPLPASGQPEIPQDVRDFSPGQTVRILREPHAGSVGTLEARLQGVREFPSGVRAAAARVRLESGEDVLIPLANLEVLR